MKSIFILSRVQIIVVSIALFLSAGVALAAVQLFVTQQRVKTLQATFTYQDVISAPQLFGNPNTRLLKIVNIPPGVEIISAYIKVNIGFDAQGQEVNSSLGIYDNNQSVQVDGLATGSIREIGIRNDKQILSKTLVFDGQNGLELLVSSDIDLANLTSGSMQIFVNHLEH